MPFAKNVLLSNFNPPMLLLAMSACVQGRILSKKSLAWISDEWPLLWQGTWPGTWHWPSLKSYNTLMPGNNANVSKSGYMRNKS